MTFTFNALMLQPIVALLAGILILLVPRILNFIVAIYLIFVGVTGFMASPSIRHSALKGRRAVMLCLTPLQPQASPAVRPPRT